MNIKQHIMFFSLWFCSIMVTENTKTGRQKTIRPRLTQAIECKLAVAPIKDPPS